jgi:hypothetical protein
MSFAPVPIEPAKRREIVSDGEVSCEGSSIAVDGGRSPRLTRDPSLTAMSYEPVWRLLVVATPDEFLEIRECSRPLPKHADISDSCVSTPHLGSDWSSMS